MNQPKSEPNVTRRVFDDPIVQLAAICPICALSALDPAAALSALSPVLAIFNPAINPRAALLAFVLGGPGGIQAQVGARVATRLTGVHLKAQSRGLIR